MYMHPAMQRGGIKNQEAITRECHPESEPLEHAGYVDAYVCAPC